MNKANLNKERKERKQNLGNYVALDLAGYSINSLTVMKLNKSVINARNSRNVKPVKVISPKGKGKAVKPTVAPATASKGKTRKEAKAVYSMEFALLTGVRGAALRKVEVMRVGGETFIRATQTNTGLSIPRTKDSVFAKLDGDTVSGDKDARLWLGTYVNGKHSGAKCQLFTKLADLEARCQYKGELRWKADSAGTSGVLAIGDPAVKGMIGVILPYKAGPYLWQGELDSNSHNAHERTVFSVTHKRNKQGKFTTVA